MKTAFVFGFLLAVSQVLAQGNKGTWAFEPATDDFSPDARFDLRALNEKTAGESGFVTRTPDGSHFALGNGKPIRFWAVNVPSPWDMKELEHHARWLAKRGVNMVRFHDTIANIKEGSQITDVNQEAIDHCWKLVAAMKKQGIYTTISPYWPYGGFQKMPASWHVIGDKDQSPGDLLFWDPTLQKGYKAWIKALYTRPNPYTGIPLSQDPAVAIIQIQNEDSLLFWTMQNVKGEQLKEVERLFGKFLVKKYGSLEKALAAWEGTQHENDDFPHGLAGLYITWFFTQNQGGGLARRLADQLEFLGETMFQFNKMMADYYHKDLGCRQLVNAGNWKTADDVKLNDAERWSYTACDVTAVNRYFTGEHEGLHNGWSIDPGDHFTNTSCLLDPLDLPVNIKKVAGYPHIITESQWVSPDKFQSEGPFLVAAYSSLADLDNFYWFASGDGHEWQTPISKEDANNHAFDWKPRLFKWQVSTPEQLGQFPAAALMYRLGYIQKGKAVVHEERTLADLWERRSPLIAEASGFDPNRDSGNLNPKSSVKAGINPLAFLVGPVEAVYGGDPAKSFAVDFAPYLDAVHKTVKSVTGELELNYEMGLCRLNAPKAQGATGFLSKAGKIRLSDVTITSANDYATVLVVSMDDKPLHDSGNILVQVGTIARPSGWQDEETDFKVGKERTVHGKRIIKVGTAPWQVANTDVTLTIRNPSLKTATLLDANGQVEGEVKGTRDAKTGAFTFRPPSNTMYLMLN